MTKEDFQPILIATAVAGYYHTPAVWCGEEPDDLEWARAPEEVLIRDVAHGTICDEIKYRVRRDGLFVFDFTNYGPTSETEIPGYERKPGMKIPREVTQAEHDAEDKAYLRTMIINVHQACINTAHTVVHKRACQLNRLVHATELVCLTLFENNSSGHFHLPNDPFQRYLITQTTLTPEFRISHPEIRSRRLLELDTISYSFSLLEKIMSHEFPELPFLIEMLHRAAIRYSDNHHADCLIMSWTVCERLLNYAWDLYLLGNEEGDDELIRINNKRKEKLTGRDFTASIVSEALELAGEIPTELFSKIDEMRKVRNKRLHQLSAVTDTEASSSIRTTEEFIGLLTGVKVSLAISRSVPGTGATSKELLEKYRKSV